MTSKDRKRIERDRYLHRVVLEVFGDPIIADEDGNAIGRYSQLMASSLQQLDVDSDADIH